MNEPLILIAEDTADILMLLIELFESEGYRVHTASDGQAALNYLNHCIRCPDLIISDIAMPRMTGIDLVKTLRADVRFAHLPIALYSANGHYKPVAKEYSCEFLIKPFDLEEILTTITRCLNAAKEELCPDN